LVQVFLNLSLVSQVLVSIIVSAQVCDLLIFRIFSKTGALQFYPHFGWIWAETLDKETGVPFPSSIYVLSLGVVAVIVIVIPLGYINLDDNIIVQVVLSFSLKNYNPKILFALKYSVVIPIFRLPAPSSLDNLFFSPTTRPPSI
jgi:hypothetical protein